MLRKWTFLPPRSHLIRQFVKRHLVTLQREQHVLAQWLRQYFCQDHSARSVGTRLPRSRPGNVHLFHTSLKLLQALIDKLRFSLVSVNLLKLKSSLQDIASQLHEVLGGRSSYQLQPRCWVAHWEKQPAQSHPVSVLGYLQHADEDQFPNVKQLLCIDCTPPVGSTDAEWSFSAFWRIKTYLQTRMSQDRLLGLALMHVHHGLHVDMKEIC